MRRLATVSPLTPTLSPRWGERELLVPGHSLNQELPMVILFLSAIIHKFISYGYADYFPLPPGGERVG